VYHSVVGHAEHSSASADPVLRVALRLEFQVHDEVGRVTRGGQLSSSLTGLVKRTVVHAVGLDLVLEHGLKPDDRERRDSNLVIHLIDDPTFEFPLSAFDVTSVNVHSEIRCLCDALKAAFFDVGLEVELVDLKLILTSVHLEGSCLESLREEESRDPVALGRAVGDPVTHEGNTLE